MHRRFTFRCGKCALAVQHMNPAGETTNAVSGMLPHRGYAAHAHANACGDKPGTHYQNRVDAAATPARAITNPEYANPRNEVWLDIRTAAAGSRIACVTLAAAARQGFHPLG